MKQILLCTLLLITPIHGYAMENKRQRTTNEQIREDTQSKEDDKHEKEYEEVKTPKRCFEWMMRIITAHPHNHRGYNFDCNV